MALYNKLGKELLLLDGALGTVLQDSGLAPGELPELWNMAHGGVVSDIHRAYVRAGCHIISTNTFGANRLKLADTGYSVEQVVSTGVRLAKEAAGGLACTALSVGPTGKLLAPFGDLEFETAVDIFSEMVTSGCSAGVDLILIETMSDTYEIKAAMLAAKENSDLPIFVTFTPDESGRLLTGADIPTVICLIEALGADALGINCGQGPKQMKMLLPELLKYSSLPIIVCPNAGIPERVHGKTVFSVTTGEFAAYMADIAASGAHIVGGCCGTTPAHLEEVSKACARISPTPVSCKLSTVVSSYGQTVVFGERTLIIGERLNPTGKPRMKQALREGNLDYIHNEGLDQIENGADILDVNVGIPDIDEADMLARVVQGLQSITSVPLQIDTANPAAAERALRVYNGKPLLNSVNGKRESLETILPLAKKYGAAVVALTLDDSGIPPTPDGRIRIAERIVAEAERFGIPKKDIVADALTMTVSTGSDNARVTLETMGRLREQLGLHTVLGLSNVSFGLPERERINAAFFTLAMNRGLSAGIVNPSSEVMMDAYHIYGALSGADANCARYIGRFSSKSAPIEPVTPENANLFEAIIHGLREQAAKYAKALTGQLPAMEIIERHLIPALDKVGHDFEVGIRFLPQLLMSAEAAKAAFEVIKRDMSNRGESQRKQGKIILATVLGDIHDIGKNIVKVLLENYNYYVIDLGKNVPPEVVAEAVLREKTRLVGLSALMTTTVANMEETILLLKEKAPDCRVMVGGAVLTQAYADRMGADFYSKDALGAVRCAQELFT